MDTHFVDIFEKDIQNAIIVDFHENDTIGKDIYLPDFLKNSDFVIYKDLTLGK